jgi:hypothetical protein
MEEPRAPVLGGVGAAGEGGHRHPAGEFEEF